MKLLILLLISNLAYGSFLPPNEIKIPQDSFEKDFQLGDKYLPYNGLLSELYSEEVKKYNAELLITVDSSSDRVNAYASRVEEKNLWLITFKIGLLRHPKLTSDIYTAILCHEMGHHLGGAPKKAEDSWVSAEGQADYFATNDCLKKMLRNKKLFDFNHLKLPQKLQTKCELLFPTADDALICKKSIAIGLEASSFVRKMSQGRRQRRLSRPSLTKRDPGVVSSTYMQHPAPQCRLDTYIEGSLCMQDFFQSDLIANCTDHLEIYEGSRPRCWYAPKG